MKIRILTALAGTLVVTGAFAQPSNSIPSVPPTPVAAGPEPVAPDKKAASTALGESFAVSAMRQLETMGLEPLTDIDPVAFATAIPNTFAGGPHLLPMDEENSLLQKEAAFARARVVVEQQKMMATGPANKAKGDKFMADNAKQPGVTTLPSGLQYKVLQAGTGAFATSSNLVTMSIRITSLEGEEYLKVEHRTTDALRRVIPPGIAQALDLMQEGSKWIVYLPPDLAYGEKMDPFVSANRPPRFGPETALIWEVTIESVAPRPVRPPMPARGTPPTGGGPTQANPERISSSEIVRIPSAAEYAQGKTNPEVGTLEYFQKQQAEAAAKAKTNSAGNPTNAAASN